MRVEKIESKFVPISEFAHPTSQTHEVDHGLYCTPRGAQFEHWFQSVS